MMMMKSQLERLQKNELQTLHISRRLLKAIAEEVVENQENHHHHHHPQLNGNEPANEEEEDAQGLDPSTTTTPWISTLALLDRLCSAMDASSSTLQEVWINDDMIQYCSKTATPTDNKEKQEEYAGKSLCHRNRLLHTLTTLPCLRRLRFFLSSTMTKSQSEDFMQVVAPTIRACTVLQSLHFCMSNSSRPAPAAAQHGHHQDDDELLSIHPNTPVPSTIISVGFFLTPTALHTLANGGLENHTSLSEFGLQDVVIVGNHKPQTAVAATAESLQFPLDPILMALASLPQLETVDISLSKPLPATVLQPRQHGLHRHQSRPKPVAVVTSTSTTRKCYFSGRALGTFFQKARRLQDCTLWDVGLNDEHFLSSSSQQQHHHLLLPALQCHPRLQFLSLRGNPGMTRNGWWQFYKMLLHGNYTLKSLFHDGGFGEDVEQAMDQVLYWNLLGRGRLFSSSPSPPSSSSLSDSASPALSLASRASKSSSSTRTSTSCQDVEAHDSIVSDWIDMLESVNDDVTSLFYFLRQGNAILMPPSSS